MLHGSKLQELEAAQTADAHPAMLRLILLQTLLTPAVLLLLAVAVILVPGCCEPACAGD
jgi:hypothetical protein